MTDLRSLRHIIFSRKGFDSGAGGGASPIIDGRPISLPIPTAGYPGGRRYADLAGDRAALAFAASRGRQGADTLCHLDPDIDAAALPTRPDGWRGAFGQAGAALGHLRNQGVGEGDLFLFFGRFRPSDTRQDEHAVYGWLRVGQVLRGEALRDHPVWLADHPHVAPGWPNANAIFVAADRLGLPGAEDLPGWGVLARSYRLSVAPGDLSRWMVPGWLEHARMSYHRDDRCWPGDGTMRVTAQWQEGIAAANDDAIAWAGALIADHAA